MLSAYLKFKIKSEAFVPGKLLGQQIYHPLKKVSWTPIVRQVLITYDYSPFNKNLKDYFEKLDMKEFDRNNVAYRQKLAKKQKYKCSLCSKSIANGTEGLEMHHKGHG